MHVHPAGSTGSGAAPDRQPPAKAARAAIADQPDLANDVFGKLVSEFARGIPVSSAQSSTGGAATVSTPSDSGGTPLP